MDKQLYFQQSHFCQSRCELKTTWQSTKDIYSVPNLRVLNAHNVPELFYEQLTLKYHRLTGESHCTYSMLVRDSPVSPMVANVLSCFRAKKFLILTSLLLNKDWPQVQTAHQLQISFFGKIEKRKSAINNL